MPFYIMKNHPIIPVALATGLVLACVPDGPVAVEASLSANKSAVTVEADNFLNFDPFAEDQSPVVTDTITITSSVSWTTSVVTADGGAWVRPSVNERINVAGSPETVQLVLTFDRYRGSSPRTADLYIHGAGLDSALVIPVTQKAWAPVLEAYAYGESVGVPAKGGECYVVIRSNTEWTARIDASASTTNPVLSPGAGEGTGAVLLSFPANVDDEKAAMATFVASADGCTPVKLEFVQQQSERFFRLDGEVPEEIAPYEKSVYIPLRSNGPWTAELSDCTFANANLLPSYGKQCLDGFYLISDHGGDPDVPEKHATVTIHREGMDDLVYSFRQAGSIHISICTYDPEYVFEGSRYNDIDNPYTPYTPDEYPFLSPSTLPVSYNNRSNAGEVLDCVLKNGGWTFTMFGTDCGVWREATTYGLMVGKKKNDYVLFPAVEGMRLAGMYYEASCRARVPYTVRNEDGSKTIKGGERSETRQVLPVASNHHDLHVHTFPDTEPSARYRLNLEEDYYALSIKELCLVYEK